eukprot:gene28662-37644_t
MEFMMQLALQEAENALKSNEIPVGCVFSIPKDASESSDREVVVTGSNETNKTRNGTAHADVSSSSLANLVSCAQQRCGV